MPKPRDKALRQGRQRRIISASALLVVLLLVAGFFAGPRVDISWNIQPLALPDDLEVYLAQQEAALTDLRPDLAKTIVWAEPASPAVTPVALVYLHGFSASHRELYPLPQRLAQDLGANLYLARLTGHGRSGAAMAEAQLSHWMQDVHEAISIGQRLGERVVVLANSTGATLATLYAATHSPKDLQALLLLSPNFAAKDPRAQMLTWPWAYHFVPWITGPDYYFTPYNAAHARDWTTRFPSTALLPMGAAVKAVRQAPLETLRIPTLMLYHPQDQVVAARASETTFMRLGATPKALFAVAQSDDPGNHLLAGDALSPRTTDAVLAILHLFLTLDF
ncbi:alpha/beta hydrolase [Thiorhodospira sibirica]|uniref:alpha/beta hydrolase n=1 Tax=Thiorhodospira sibirica TaxID=154347 RepID=UPI00022C33E6|nr:alpha/beta fold hydrolase [Thiorhodospira sibirica]